MGLIPIILFVIIVLLILQGFNMILQGYNMLGITFILFAILLGIIIEIIRRHLKKTNLNTKTIKNKAHSLKKPRNWRQILRSLLTKRARGSAPLWLSFDCEENYISLFKCKTFDSLVKKIMEFEDKSVTYFNFGERTTLDEMTFSRLKKPKKQHIMRTVITFCVGYRLDILLTIKLVELAGIPYTPEKKTHCEYYQLIIELMNDKQLKKKNEIIKYCNDVLSERGLKNNELLGSMDTREMKDN